MVLFNHNKDTSNTSDEMCAALSRMKAVVEKSTPFRPFTMGQILNDKTGEMVKFPKTDSPTADQMLKDAELYLKYHYEQFTLHGIKFGKGMKTIMVPKFTKGTLLTWPEGEYGVSITDHVSDAHINIKEYFSAKTDGLCHIYFYGYITHQGEDAAVPDKITQRINPQMDASSTTSSPTTTEQMSDVAEPPQPEADHKRKGLETRTVVLAPEKKKLRVDYQAFESLHLRSLWWMTQRPRKVLTEPHAIWYEESLRWIQKKKPPTPRPTESFLLHLPCKTKAYLNSNLLHGEIYRVDEDTDVMDETAVYKHWEAFEESDASEMKQFVDEKVFKKVKLEHLPEGIALVDATWVRKFKRTPDGKLKAKSRLCARGFLDPQKEELPTRSTTATRLSQRLIVSVAASYGFVLASLDASGAFLKGFSFSKEILRGRGIPCPDRRVVIVPPANVWRLLAMFDKSFHLDDNDLGFYGLECLEPAYGLVDAPLAWQLCLHQTLEENGGSQSLLDENLWHFKNDKGVLQAVITTHVDDLAVASSPQFLKDQHKMLTAKFGKMTIQELPFNHCGCRYTKLADGYKIDQEEFTLALKTAEIENTSDPSRALLPAEISKLRSILGGLLWLTSTRLDLVSDVGVIQSRITKATVADFQTANAIVKKAKTKQYQDVGIIFRQFPANTSWRLAVVHDASSASKGRAYSQEGVMVLLMPDYLDLNKKIHTINGNEVSEKNFSGHARILFAHGGKSKRISYSTSHAETLAAMSGLEISTLVSLRLAELLLPDRKPTLQQLFKNEEFLFYLWMPTSIAVISFH